MTVGLAHLQIAWRVLETLEQCDRWVGNLARDVWILFVSIAFGVVVTLWTESEIHAMLRAIVTMVTLVQFGSHDHWLIFFQKKKTDFHSR